MTSKKKFNIELIIAFFAGIMGGIITWLVTDILSVKQNRVLFSELVIDSNEARQGMNSLRWSFLLRPEKKYMFSSTSMVGGYLHLEVRPDKKGNVPGLNLSNYSEIRFFAKASSETFLLNEINLFTGKNYIQYIYAMKDKLLFNTKWAEYRIPLLKFMIAPWERQYRYHLINKNYMNMPNMKNISGLGFDLKTTGKPLSGFIWIDYVRLINKNGDEVVLSDGDSTSFIFLERQLVWVTGANEFQ